MGQSNTNLTQTWLESHLAMLGMHESINQIILRIEICAFHIHGVYLHISVDRLLINFSV